MGNARLSWFTVVLILCGCAASLPALAQEAGKSTVDGPTGSSVGLVAGHPFSAIKYAWQVKILSDGKPQFIRNERYPTRIARDADGRLMMQMIYTDKLPPECDHLDQLVPPVCPVWNVFVIDPVAHKITHWAAGELGAHDAVEFPLSPTRLEETIHATAEVPDLTQEADDQDGKVTTTDLGAQTIEGIQAHGVRSTLQYTKEDSGRKIEVTRIHEVWTAPEMKLIVRVIDGDPTGVETFWGLEKVSLKADPELFQPPDGYSLEHRVSPRWAGMVDEFTSKDFEFLQQWFAE